MKSFHLTLTVFTSLLSCLHTKDLLSCVYHEGRRLTCSLAEPRQPLTSCSMCDYFNKMKCSELVGKCSIYERCERTIKGQYGDYRGVAVIFPLPPSNTSTCQQMTLRHLVKPGAVQFLKVDVINATALSVSWCKPDDYDNSDLAYLYQIVVDTGQDKQEIRVEGTKVRNQTRAVRVAQSWRNASVSVTGRMELGGLYGASVTTYLSNSIPLVPPVPLHSSPPDVVYYLLGGVVSLISITVCVWAYRKRKTLCSKLAITLPGEFEGTLHSKPLLHAATQDQVPSKRASRDGSAPQQDSGHYSMETSHEGTLLGQNAAPSQEQPASGPGAASASNSKQASASHPEQSSASPTQEPLSSSLEQASASHPEQASASRLHETRACSLREDSNGQEEWMDGSALSYDRWVPRSEINDLSSCECSLNIGQDYGVPEIGILGNISSQKDHFVEGSQRSDRFVPRDERYGGMFRNPACRLVPFNGTVEVCQNDDDRLEPHEVGCDESCHVPQRIPILSEDRCEGSTLISDDRMVLCDVSGADSRISVDRHSPSGERSDQESLNSDYENVDYELNYCTCDVSESDKDGVLSVASSASLALSDAQSISSYTGITLHSSHNQI